jgi:hypothetical protein
VVALAYAVVDPGTVVVMSFHTAVADSAVMCAHRTVDLAGVADLQKGRRRV